MVFKNTQKWHIENAKIIKTGQFDMMIGLCSNVFEIDIEIVILGH